MRRSVTRRLAAVAAALVLGVALTIGQTFGAFGAVAANSSNSFTAASDFFRAARRAQPVRVKRRGKSSPRRR